MLFRRAWSALALLAAGGACARSGDDHSNGERIEGDLKILPLRTHSLQSPYLDSHMHNRWFDFGGDSVIRTDQFIRLTGEYPSRSGWVFSRVPLTATNWEIEVEFKIEGTGSLYGDGMAIWLTKQRAQQGPVFGFTDKFEGLAIFIDTYKNDRPGVVFPYVMAMMGDGNTVYDKAHDGKANELAGCPAHGVRNGQNSSRIKMRYFHDKSLDVSLSYDAEHKTWEKCFSLPNVKLPSVAYLGFSAETGELSDNHDLVSVETRNLYELNQGQHAGSAAGAAAGAASEKGGRRRKKGQKETGFRHSWTWLLIKFLLLGFVVAAVYIGFTAYRSQKSRSRF